MFSKLRPLIFKFDPETAHNLAIKSLKLNFVPNIFDENKNDPMFQTNLFERQIENPIGLAAGFDKNAEVYNPLFKLGFGFVEVGTVTPLKQLGNPKPRVFRLEEDQALINRLGFNSFGASNVNSTIRSNPPNGLLGVNIGPNKDTKDKLNDYLICLKTFHDIADYITINISSPNTENLRDFHDQNRFEKLISLVEKTMKELKSNTPIVIKISPDISNEQAAQISGILLNHNIKAIIVSNTTEGNREKLLNTSKHQKGGLSGKPLETRSNQLINTFYNLLKGKISIIGVGGVDSGKSAYAKFLAGANFIQLYTGMIYQGPSIVSKIKKELKELLINEDVRNFQDIIGKEKN
tara:strand:- start:360 stop:1409 length:1050 start_codon:yes stop_codon:yes gene_type:complete